MSPPSLPPHEMLARQAAWLEPARARLLRRVSVARRRRVLDLGCGSGAVTGELVRRAGGKVLALDRSRHALGADAAPFASAVRLCGDAAGLPLADGTVDLVFCQWALMWMDAAAVLAEVRRVLAPGGALVALEPDYGALIEHPPQIATRVLWLAALRRAGADPRLGRKLPGLLAPLGFEVQVDLLDRVTAPDAARFDLLRGLPLTDDERETLARVEQADRELAAAARVVHLPMFLITAVKT
jgi:SAM-dependent methyltransferase